MKNTEKYSLNNKFTLGTPYTTCFGFIYGIQLTSIT